jgi:hypothetical protein
LHYGLRTTPERACTYIVACVVLHNIGIDRRDIMDMVVEAIDISEEANVQVAENAVDGKVVRDAICNTHFL